MTEPSPPSAPHLTAITPGIWRVDPAAGEIRFHTRKLGLIPVKGRFEDFAGELRIEEAGTAFARLTIEAGSIKTGIKKRDAHLRSADFFQSDEYPQLIFASDAIVIGDSARVSGNLRIRDKEIPIEAPVKIESIDDDLRLVTDFEVDHDSAGLGWTKPGLIRKTMAAHVELTLVAAQP